MKLEINDTFTIGYFAKKLFTYYDLTNEGYRTAKGQYTLIAVGGSNG